MMQRIGFFSPLMGSCLNTGLQLQLTALRQGKKLSQGGGRDGNSQKMCFAMPRGSIQETEACCREGTGTHYIPVTTDSIFLFNPARRGLILRIIPGFELLGIGLSRVVGIGRTDQINADGLQTTHGLENWG